MKPKSMPVLTLAIVVVVACDVEAPRDNAPPGAATVTPTASSPPEAKLAVIDRERPTVPVALVEQFARNLDTLATHCAEPRDRIADMIVAAREQLQTRYARRMSLLEFSTAASTMMRESGLTSQACAETLTVLVVGLGSS